MANLMTLNGPNLNLLGSREPQWYGSIQLEALDQTIIDKAKSLGHEMQCFQSNAEHVLIDHIHSAREQQIDFIIINPGAFTHTSIAVRDALSAVAIPFIEVHLSNIYAREQFRHKSYFADIAIGTITGFGPLSYELAVLAAHDYLIRKTKEQ